MERNNMSAATGGVRFKTGTVTAVQGGSVKVMFDDIGLPSGWLTVCYPKTQNDKAIWTYDLGEQVRCIMDANLEDGAVLGAVYSSADAVPWASGAKVGWAFSDGGGFSYDKASGEFDTTAMGNANITVKGNANLQVGGSATVQATGQATIDAPQTIVTGGLTVKGATLLLGGVGGEGGAGSPIPGDVQAEGNVRAIDGDVTAGDISLRNHDHIDSMGGTTSKAQG